MTPTLIGDRVRLEPLTLDHLPRLAEVAFDDRIWRYMTTPVKDARGLKAWAETALKLQAAGNTLPWVTILRKDDRPVGSTRFADLDLHHGTVELGYTWLIPALHGSGLNAEAKLLQLTYAFEDLKLHRVAFKTHHENFQSQAAMRKLGCVEEGTFRNHYIMPDGSHRHSVWFSIIREEWPQVRSKLAARLPHAPPPSA